MTSVAIAAHVKQVHALKGMGTWTSPSASSTCRVLKLSGDECAELLRDDSFVTDVYGRMAMLEALAKMTEDLEDVTTMIIWSGPNKVSRVIRCLYGHFVNVCFRVRAFLRIRTGLSAVVVGVRIRNQGHRSLYERELIFLHDILPKDAAVHDGLQLLDGADSGLHLPVSPSAQGGVAMPPAASVGPASAAPAALPPAVLAAPVPANPTAWFAPSVSAPVGLEVPAAAVLPTPSLPVHLAPLPTGTPVVPGSQAAREAERLGEADFDQEEEDEIRPLSDEYAAQWAAYYATRS
eukprot:TRINITY_DN9994_c0_g1_i1.p1 TRINITY_DN9994_c0_g1~~TRINITY_DN9994_c0_g1_i1.p1  ORF type:complete len:292 (-),score=50.69 TRINITY_DN9994_c0_g1_i1:419-1294(-)